MKHINLLLVLTLLFFTSMAQETATKNFIANIVPPSPNASSLGKFGSIPVGLSTGIPSISIPIYNWKGVNFAQEINVSLNYHAGGIQVDELASNVGLGWSLNAGGVISRTMRGIYDEYPVDGFLYNQLPTNDLEGNGPAGNTANERIFNRMYAGKSDSQCDIFNFSFNGRSGRFILGKNNDVLLLDRSKLKIEKVITNPSSASAQITEFIITDEYGYRYQFSEYEITMTNTTSLPPPHNSSWYLSRITNPAGTEYISFEYDEYELGAIQSSRTQAQAIPINLDGVNQPANLGGISGYTLLKGKRIKKIVFTDDITVSFFYNSSYRSDLPTSCTDRALEKISISDGTKSYGYRLFQNYSLGGRLTLLSVQQYGQSESDTLKPYSFLYSPLQLPGRFSSTKDHWGYTNGNATDGLIPREYLLIGANNGPYSPYREFTGVNRDTDPNLVLAGSLTRLTYPTGGYTDFFMEANKAVDPWLNSAITVQIPNPYTEIQNIVSYNSSGNGVVNQTFTYTGANNANVQFTLSSYAVVTESTNCYIKIEMFNAANNEMYATQNLNVKSSSSSQLSTNFTMSNLMNGQQFYVKAYLIGYLGSGGTYYGTASLTMRQQNPPNSTIPYTLGNNQLYVGGLRAKKIVDYSNQGLVTGSKEYEYVLSDGTTSSGSLGYRPVYSYQVKYDTRLLANGNDGGSNYYFDPYADYVVRSSSSVNETPLVSGAPVTYSRVIEKITGNNGGYLGKTVRTFSSFADSRPYISEEFPTVPMIMTPWIYGLLKSEQIYDSTNTLLKTTENRYTYFSDGYSTDQARVENFRSIAFAPLSFQYSEVPRKLNPIAYPGWFKMKSFFPTAGRSELNETIVSEIVKGQPSNITITKFEHDNENFYVTEERKNDSNNGETLVRYSRPSDMVSANENAAVYSKMVSLNIVDPVIKKTYFRNNSQLYMEKTEYKEWFNNLFAPQLIITKNGIENEEIRLRYLNYDAFGAPLSLQRENGPRWSYIWGYGGNKLIATIEDAPQYSVVLSTLGDVNAFRNLKSPDSNQIDNFLSPILGLRVNVFKYSSLSGLSSLRDAKGMTTYYEYDVFQRLKNVKDQNGNILKHTDYNYKH